MDDLDAVMLVDERDRVIGSAPKLEAHRRRLRHRAFSVFIHDRAGRVLLQRRAKGKYHSGGLWSNACCGHPRPGEGSLSAASRRINEEMRLLPRLRAVGKVSYEAKLPRGWHENEVVHLFCGLTDEEPEPDRAEVEDWCWITPASLLDRVAAAPATFSSWFRIYLLEVPSLVLRPDG
jgi:isopentenyl-diphosphate Delta-isomerase